MGDPPWRVLARPETKPKGCPVPWAADVLVCPMKIPIP